MRRRAGIALHHGHVARAHAQLLGHDLCQRRLKALPVRGGGEGRRHRPGGVNADRGGFRPGIDRHPWRDGDPRSDPGQFRVGAEADAQPAPLCPCPVLPRAETGQVGDLDGLFQAFHEAGVIPPDARADAEWEILWPHEVAPPDLGRVQPQLGRRHVDQPLHREDGHRPPDAAIGPGRRLGGADAAHATKVGGSPVGAGQEAGNLHRLQRGSPGGDGIGPDIADDVGLKRQKGAVTDAPVDEHSL